MKDAERDGDAAGGPQMTKKAQLRHVAVRDYARLRLHARNCPDCRPGADDTDPPWINQACRAGMAGRAAYLQAYRAWVDCPETA